MNALVAIASFGDAPAASLERQVRSARELGPGADVVVLSDRPRPVPDGAVLTRVAEGAAPHALAFAHRALFADRADDYDVFIFTQDDVLISPENVHAFAEVAGVLPEGQVPGFFRVGAGAGGGQTYPDAYPPHRWLDGSVDLFGGYAFATFTNRDAGCYALTQSQLRAAVATGGYLAPPTRGAAAADPYTPCGLRRRVCVSEFDRFLVRHTPPDGAAASGLSDGAMRAELDRLLRDVTVPPRVAVAKPVPPPDGAPADEPVRWDEFELTRLNPSGRAPWRVTLRAGHGRYLGVDPGGHGRAAANRRTPGPCETFELVRLDDLADDVAKVALRGANGRYLGVSPDDCLLYAAADSPSEAPLDLVRLKDLGGGRWRVRLVAGLGRPVTAAELVEPFLAAAGREPAPDGLFEMVRLGADEEGWRVAFRGPGGYYAGVEAAGEGRLTVSRTSPGPSETFVLTGLEATDEGASAVVRASNGAALAVGPGDEFVRADPDRRGPAAAFQVVQVPGPERGFLKVRLRAPDGRYLGTRPGPGSRVVADREPMPAETAHEPGPWRPSPGDTAPGPWPNGGRVRVGLLTPSLALGGAERWMIALARHCDPDVVSWTGVALAGPAWADPRVCREMSRLMPVYAGPDADAMNGDVLRLPTTRLAVAAVAERADVLVVWGLRNVRALTRGFQGRVVMVSHASSDDSFPVVRAAEPAATDLVAVSTASRAAFSPAGRARAVILYNGVEAAHCAPTLGRDAQRARWGFEPRHRLVGSVGRFAREKNPWAVAQAVRRLGGDHRALFIGSGWGPDAPVAAASHGLDVTFIPPQARMGDVLAALDALVLASPAEGFSMSLTEAWLAGVPTVATRVGAVPELERLHGPLVSPVPCDADADQLARAVEDALSPPHAAVVRHAREVAWNHYTAAAMAARWTHFFLQTAAKRPEPAAAG